MNMKLPFLIISLITVFGCVGNTTAGPFSGTRAAAKPQSPVTVEIYPTPDSLSSETIDFVVNASSQISASQFAIVVNPPKDMELVRGELTWQGAIQAGQTKTLNFSGTFKQRSNQRILVNAIIRSPSGPRFSARDSYVVPSSNNNIKALSESQPTGQEQGKTKQRGEHTVIEYPVGQ